MRKIKLKKIKKFFGATLKVLAERAFFTSLVLIFLASIIGILVFYKYSILVDEEEIILPSRSSWLEENALTEILNKLDQRQIIFEEVESKEYPNLFRESISEVKEGTELTE